MNTDRLRVLFDVEGIDEFDGFDDFDLDDETERMELVEQFAPLPARLPERTVQMAMRTVAVNQILDDDPPETWLTAQRLLADGLDHEAVLSQLSIVIGEHLSAALSDDRTFDVDDYVEALEELPLATAADITRRLVETARSLPGVSVDRLVDLTVASLGSRNGTVLEELVDQVLDHALDGPLHLLPDDRTVVVPDLVAPATFTHRLTDAEAELEMLNVGFDLGAFSRFDTVRLGDGTELEQFSVDIGHLGWRGPEGWLDRFDPGDLLACTVEIHTDGDRFSGPTEATMAIEVVVDEPDSDDAVVEWVRAGYDSLVAEPDLPVSGDELALWLLFHHPEAFESAQQPLGDLASVAGLEQHRSRVAHDDRIWRNDLYRRRLHMAWDVVPEPNWRRILGRALDVLDDPGAAHDEVRATLDECAEPEVLDVLADVLFGHYLDLSDEFERDRVEAPGRLFELVERATALARRPREVATARYLACVLYERCGAPELAEAHLKRAGEAQPRLGPVVERLGWYRFDRGDARGAMRWWRTLTEIPDAATTIQPFLAPSTGDKLGRNDPCWCGSGRKFKQCHQNVADMPALPDRVPWLCRKASLWLEHTTGEVRDSLVELAMTRATGEPNAEQWQLAELDQKRIRDAFADPIVFDVALHENGLFDLFLHERAQLLPEDEQLLAASWNTVDRSVHEVVAVEPGISMTLRNLATGDVLDVRERTASRQMKTGERFCARVVPDGASNQIIGGIFPVQAGYEATVLDLCDAADPIALCAWVGALYRPPNLVHTPGLIDEMFDRDAIEAMLAGFDEDADPDETMAALQEELNRQAHTRWLDEHVPALAGLTPREAAADPTRREQLERLLSEFESDKERMADLPDGFQPFTYDVDALRRELGLD